MVEQRYSIETMAAQLVELYRPDDGDAMSLLVISPDFASHYGPLAVLAKAAHDAFQRVVVATGPNHASARRGRRLRVALAPPGCRARTAGVAVCDPSLERFIAATSAGPIATLRRQALDRERDLLWQPEQVATEVARLCDEIEPEHVIVDHVSFASTLAMYATERPFVTLVPGHPSQLPVGSERYGVPETWPLRIRPDPQQLAELAPARRPSDRRLHRADGMRRSPLSHPAARRSMMHSASTATRVLYNSIRRCKRRPAPMIAPPMITTSSGRWSVTNSSRPNWAAGRPAVTTAHRYTSRSVRSCRTAATCSAGSPTRCDISTCAAAIATGATPVERLG